MDTKQLTKIIETHYQDNKDFFNMLFETDAKQNLKQKNT